MNGNPPFSPCKYCGQKITWGQEGRKRVPLESSGQPHTCPEFQKARRSYRNIDPKSLSQDVIAQYERAMNQRHKKK